MPSVSRQKILMIHGHTDMYGSGQIFLRAYQALVKHYNVHVILPGGGEAFDRLSEAGAPITCLSLGVLRKKYLTPWGLLNRAWHLVKGVHTLRRIIRKEGVTLVYTNTLPVFAGPLAARLTRVKHLWHCHETPEKPFFIVSLYAFMIRSFANHLVCVSNPTQSHWKKHTNNAKTVSISRVFNGIDPFPAVTNCPFKVGSNSTVMLTVGRISAQKGTLEAVAIAHEVLLQNPSTHYVWVGSIYPGNEPYLAEVNRLISSFSTKERMHFVGQQAEVGGYFQHADVYLHPSIEMDSFPTTILEAMHARLPIVSTTKGGATDMIEHNVSGMLYHPENAEGAVTYLNDLLADSNKLDAFGKHAQKRVQSVFSPEAFAKNITLAVRDTLDS